MGRVISRGVLVLFCICICGIASAEEIETKWSVGLVGGGVFPKDEDSDDTYYVGGNLAYGINDYIAVGGEVGYSRWTDEVDGIEYGKISHIPLLADLYVRYPIKVGDDDNLLVPYAVGGVGVVFWDYKESSYLKDLGISMDTEDGVGYKAGIGIDYYFTKNVSIGIESSYLWSDADVTASSAAALASAEIDTDEWMVNGCIKYHF